MKDKIFYTAVLITILSFTFYLLKFKNDYRKDFNNIKKELKNNISEINSNIAIINEKQIEKISVYKIAYTEDNKNWYLSNYYYKDIKEFFKREKEWNCPKSVNAVIIFNTIKKVDKNLEIEYR